MYSLMACTVSQYFKQVLCPIREYGFGLSKYVVIDITTVGKHRSEKQKLSLSSADN